ncbi:MAG: 2-amino-4-hydroxy-6-hydroxymethyldihydropteridine diphosphokinase [Prevotella sp.]|nr:2-amino-4-hydroxy-6-hydroxymethyldihydropteridine diphosphokinase [Prevotella sp.]
MIPIILALGSNTEAESRMAQARVHLERLLEGNIRFTRTLWTDPVNFGRQKFLNGLAGACTSLSLPELQFSLKGIEKRCGRTPEGKLREEVKMDIDLLQYGARRLHLSDWDRKYVQILMAELGFPFFSTMG